MLSFVLPLLALGCGGKVLDVGGQVDAPDAASPTNDVIVPSWPVAAQRNARSLHSEGLYLYWIADRGQGSAILRCEKRDCANTQTPVHQRERDQTLLGMEVRGDFIYVVQPQGIYSCRTSDCTTLTAVVADIKPSAVAFDEDHVYWSNRLDSKIYSCPLAGCGPRDVSVRINGTDALELAVDATTLYWISGDSAYPHPPSFLMSAPKDGSVPPKALALRQNQAASLRLHNGFVFWATSFTVGTVAQCPLAGCRGDQPEILADHQYFPLFVDVVADAIFWMNGSSAPGDPRPVQIASCQPASCSSTLEVLDQGTGGSRGARRRTPGTFGDAMVAPRELAVDDDAVYWFGDVVNLGPPGNEVIVVDASIRRTERRRTR